MTKYVDELSPDVHRQLRALSEQKAGTGKRDRLAKRLAKILLDAHLVQPPQAETRRNHLRNGRMATPFSPDRSFGVVVTAGANRKSPRGTGR